MPKKKEPESTELTVEKSRTLLDLAAEASEICRLIDESEGELSPELEQRIAFNNEALVSKVDGYAFVIDELERQAEAWKARKEEAAANQKRFEFQSDRLKERIKIAMKEMERTEITGQVMKFTLGRSAPKLVLEDEAAIPSEFKMIVQTTVIDRERIKTALADGFAVAGARLEESGSLRRRQFVSKGEK